MAVQESVPVFAKYTLENLRVMSIMSEKEDRVMQQMWQNVNNWEMRLMGMQEFLVLFLKDLLIFGCAGTSLLSMRTFSSCSEWGLLSIMVCGLLIAEASLVAKHRLQARVGSVVVAHGLCCSTACGIFLDQE